MAATVTVARTGGATTQARSPKPMFVIVSETGRRVTLPFAPVPSTHGGFGYAWNELDRAGREALLARGKRNSKTWSATATVGHPNIQTSIQPTLDALEAIANSGERCSITYGTPERGLWRMVEPTWQVDARQQGTNDATRAQVTLTFKKAVDLKVPIGPPRKPATTGLGKTPPTQKKPTARTVTVKQGDTLWGIAVTVYGDGNQWRKIGDANKITDPTTLQVGRVLTIPTS